MRHGWWARPLPTSLPTERFPFQKSPGRRNSNPHWRAHTPLERKRRKDVENNYGMLPSAAIDRMWRIHQTSPDSKNSGGPATPASVTTAHHVRTLSSRGRPPAGSPDTEAPAPFLDLLPGPKEDARGRGVGWEMPFSLNHGRKYTVIINL